MFNGVIISVCGHRLALIAIPTRFSFRHGWWNNKSPALTLNGPSNHTVWYLCGKTTPPTTKKQWGHDDVDQMMHINIIPSFRHEIWIPVLRYYQLDQNRRKRNYLKMKLLQKPHFKDVDLRNFRNSIVGLKMILIWWAKDNPQKILL